MVGMLSKIHKLGQFRENLKLRSWIKLIENSQLFDTEWYLEQYPDVARSGVNPLIHYILSGAKEGRDPNPLFDTEWYLQQYPEIARAGINPLVHYLVDGLKKGFDPNPLFDTDWYARQYSDVDNNPLAHYMLFGAAQNYDPSPLFSTKAYVEQFPHMEKFKINPLAHYLRRGTKWLEKRLPGISCIDLVIPGRSQLASFSNEKPKILFVGHDASSTGAPVLLLNIIRFLKNYFEVEAAVILLTGGPLEADYRELATTYIVDENYKVDKNYGRFKHIALNLWKENYRWALCNTAVTGKCTEILYRASFTIVSAIHEMHSVISAMKLKDECETIANYAHKVVFPASIVYSDFEKLVGDLGARAIINPQGLLMSPSIVSNAKEQVCNFLNIPLDSVLILAAGLGDLRKGLDLYLQLARSLGSKSGNFHFIWIGNINVDMAPWFQHDFDSPVLRRCFHHISFTNQLSLYYQAAQVFVLPSREDPFPSVVMDALAHGVPVVAFEKCGGYADLLATKANGELISYGDIDAMEKAIQFIVSDKAMHTEEIKKQRAQYIIAQFDFKCYVENLLKLFDTTNLITEDPVKQVALPDLVS